MGASQPGLRPMEPRNTSRAGLPNGDDLPVRMEDAPEHRIPEDPSRCSSTAQPTGGRRQADRASLRGFKAIILPLREDSEGRDERSTAEGSPQGSGTRRPDDKATGRPDSGANAPKANEGGYGSQPEGGPPSSRPPQTSGSNVPVPSGEETYKKLCFLDQFRICAEDCMAFDKYWTANPCTILRAIRPRPPASTLPPPPKVKP